MPDFGREEMLEDRKDRSSLQLLRFKQIGFGCVDSAAKKKLLPHVMMV
jgi:hypothetical protein